MRMMTTNHLIWLPFWSSELIMCNNLAICALNWLHFVCLQSCDSHMASPLGPKKRWDLWFLEVRVGAPEIGCRWPKGTNFQLEDK